MKTTENRGLRAMLAALGLMALMLVSGQQARAALLLLADDAKNQILAYDMTTRTYLNQFADATGLPAWSSGWRIRSIAANDTGSTVYVAMSDGTNSAGGARIYSFDVTVNGGTMTGSNPTLFYQHTLGNWGSRMSMTIGPDRNSDGVQDIYFTVPLSNWNNESVYWIDGVSGGTATSYQTIGTQHNRHLEFRADTGNLGWGVFKNSTSEATSWRSTATVGGTGVHNDIGTLRYNDSSAPLMTGPSLTLTNNTNWRMKDILFDEDDVMYFSSYYNVGLLSLAVQDPVTGYWTPSSFTGGGLGGSSMQPGVMTILIPEPGAALLGGLGLLALLRRRR